MLAGLFDDSPIRARAKTSAICLILIAANLLAWAWAWTAFSGRPALLGTALLAYMFGLRHAFDADHIAAIDNIVRKLMQSGKAPLSAGFFFSLGHSSVVILASVAIAAATIALQDRMATFHAVGNVVGTAVSASFLLIFGIANLFVLRGIWAAFKRVRSGDFDCGGLDATLGGGMLARLFRPVFRIVSSSWHMYPIGFLFGLGFDTATEIGVLGISASQALQGASLWAILIFPALFTAGMALMDTLDSVLMTGVYGWAFVKPLRKLWYNLTITAASVVVAIFIGGVEAVGLLAAKLGLDGGVWGIVGSLGGNLVHFGYAVVGLFIASWAVSILVYRAKGYGTVPVRADRA